MSFTGQGLIAIKPTIRKNDHLLDSLERARIKIADTKLSDYKDAIMGTEEDPTFMRKLYDKMFNWDDSKDVTAEDVKAAAQEGTPGETEGAPQLGLENTWDNLSPEERERLQAQFEAGVREQWNAMPEEERLRDFNNSYDTFRAAIEAQNNPQSAPPAETPDETSANQRPMERDDVGQAPPAQEPGDIDFRQMDMNEFRDAMLKRYNIPKSKWDEVVSKYQEEIQNRSAPRTLSPDNL